MADPGDQIIWCNSSLPSFSTSSNYHVYEGVSAQPHTPEKQDIICMCTILITKVENCWVFWVLTKQSWDTSFATPSNYAGWSHKHNLSKQGNVPHDAELILSYLTPLPHFSFHLFTSPISFAACKVIKSNKRLLFL